MKLLEDIGLELQKRYTYADLDIYFAASNISTRNVSRGDYGNSKRNYAKAVLAPVSEGQLLVVADELGIKIAGSPSRATNPPVNWNDTGDFRLFVSHISKDKLIATRLKAALVPFGISGFVAHEDIHPTLAWMDEVERGLHTMDALLAVHTKGFALSSWTQQEVGFALGKNIMIISFKWGEDPTGFIGKHQALPRESRTAEQIATLIDKLLAADDRTKERLQEAKKLARERATAAIPVQSKAVVSHEKGRPDVAKGMRVFHSKFGHGAITGIDGNKLEIKFETIGQRRVLDSFVNVV